MKSIKMRSALLLGFPILIAGFLLFLPAKEKYIQSSYQNAHQEVSWATLQEYKGCSEIALDNLGRIWMGVGLQCGGLYVFDGTAWSNIDSASQPYFDFFDFALDRKGRVWAIPFPYPDRILFYDGQKWESYPYEEGDMLPKVEVDTKGRVWVTTYSGFLLFERNSWKSISNESLGLPDGVFRLIKSDNEGRLWIAYDRSSSGNSNGLYGLYVIDGINSDQILDNGKSLKDISAMAFDHQNNLWVGTQCGGVREFADQVWKTILDEGVNCDVQQVTGIYFDNQERIWIWGSEYSKDYVRVFDKGMWTNLTHENSGIAGDQIYDLVVDKLDRVYILSSGGVNAEFVKDIQTLPQGLVDRLNWAVTIGKYLDGMRFLFPVVLTLLWLIVLLRLDIWRSVWVILGVGILTAPVVQVYRVYHLGPGGFAMISGLLGGFIGGLLGRLIETKGEAFPKLEAKWGNRFGITLMLLGLILGFIWSVALDIG